MNLPEKFTIIIPPQDVVDHPYHLQQMIKGDEKAFNWIYKQYSRRIYDYIHVLSGDVQLSEDIVQEVFLRIWKNRQQLAEVSNFNAYIYRAAKNLLISHWRKQSTESRCMETYSLTTQQHHLIDDSRELANIIHHAIDTLPPKRKIIYQLAKETGWKGEKIARSLNISICTVKAQMQKAITTVRKQVKEKINQ